jgi:4-amino-4-deoxy-L-arabinose transferase-like glycosyltransferase
VTPTPHWRRLGLLMLAASLLLGWLAAHTSIFYTDGLRYIAQAKTIDEGSITQGLVRSVDQPVYPLAIVVVHRLVGGETPRDWQRAAQLAAVAAGVLVVIPLYLIALELFGSSCAWLACLLIYLVPFNGHVLADALSEGTFLLFWSFGVWASLKLLRTGHLAWLLLVVAASVLAYLTRPEGLVILVSLVAALVVLTFCPALAFPRSTRRWALGLLVVGSLAAAGPFMFLKGGISTKPSMSRLLGLAPRAGAMAVERERPLDADQSTSTTVLFAARAVIRAVARATTIPLLLLAPLGIVAGCGSQPGRRSWIFLGIMLGLSTLALLRVHATAGYCTPRHALVVSWILILAAAAGIQQLVALLSQRAAMRLENRWTTRRIEGVFATISLGGWLLFWGPALVSPIDSGFSGYRQAGEWLARFSGAPERILDLKGLALFYAGKPGYTFTNLTAGTHDPAVRWVVAHDAFLRGPWDYCELLRRRVADRRPAAIFPEHAARGASRVYIFDLSEPGDRTASAVPVGSQPRR